MNPATLRPAEAEAAQNGRGQPQVPPRRRQRTERQPSPTRGLDANAELVPLLEQTVPQLLSVLEGTEVEELRIGWGQARVMIRRDAVPARRQSRDPARLPTGEAPSPHSQHLLRTAEEPASEPPLSPVAVTAGAVGVFRPTKGPGAPAPAQAGDCVERGQVIAYVESMGILSEVEAPLAGRLAALLVADGQPVEYGQPLATIAPPTP